MKFSKTLEFNAVREWADNYINYEKLKFLIYDIEEQQALYYRSGQKKPQVIQQPSGSNLLNEEEQKRLLSSQPDLSINDLHTSIDIEDTSHSLLHEIMAMEQKFITLFSSELDKVNVFYIKKEKGLLQEIDQLTNSIVNQAKIDEGKSENDQFMGTPTNDENVPLSRASSSASLYQQLGQCQFNTLQQNDLKSQTRSIYINLCALKDFSILNYTGFKKILKKHDKVLSLVPSLTQNSDLPKRVEDAYFWKQNALGRESSKIHQAIDKIIDIYAYLFYNGDIYLAAEELSHQLHDFVVWERNTIWKDMVGDQRRIGRAGLLRVYDQTKAKLKIHLPLIGNIIIGKRFTSLLFNLCVLLGLLLLANFFDDGPKNRCFAVLIFASLMWATEAIPLFVTSMLIPFLLVTLQVLVQVNSDGIVVLMKASDSAKFLFGKMFAPVIFLLLGGFTLAAALSKYGIAKRMATFILSKAGTKSNSVLLAIMFVAWFSSMWISNVAAPVLCFSVIQPILRTLEPGNSFAVSLIMGIALSSNIGGLATPISSPQNAIALNFMDPVLSWLQWLTISIPISFFSILICWLMLIVVYKPSKSTPYVQPITQVSESFTKKQIFIIMITILTIALWCAESAIKDVLGNSGIIAIVPMVTFFGSGILDKDDFNSFLWSVIMLAMGGISLGSAVENTSLLKVIGEAISDSLQNQDIFIVLLTFCTLVLVVATFISHTVSALILLPLVQAVGNKLPGNYANLLVMGSAIMCSGAMGLPISGFPNINAVSVEDSTGRPYVKTKDFLKIGVPMSIIVMIITVTLGYGIMLGLNIQTNNF